MTRKEFVSYIWKKGLKPSISLLVIYFCTTYLINAIKDHGPERFMSIVLLFSVLVISLAYIMGIILERNWERFYNQLPFKTKHTLSIITLILRYIVPIVLLIALYYLWVKDHTLAFIFVGIMLMDRFINRLPSN